MHRDAGHLRVQDSEGHELGVEREGGAYRAVIVLTDPELDWYFVTDPGTRRSHLELFHTLRPGQPRVVAWEAGTLLLHLDDLDQLSPRIVAATDAAVEALVEEARRRDDVRWALTSELFRAPPDEGLAPPTLDPPDGDRA